MTTYAATFDGIIWGVGFSKDTALLDAYQYCSGNVPFDVLPCSMEIYDKVSSNRGQFSWHIVNDTIQLKG